jgi:hypothetical protein
MSVNSFSGQPAIPASYGYAAGKNKIINGDFNINQRAFTSATYTTATFDNYGFDRWKMNNAGDGSSVFSTQAFTLGTAPVTGYEGTNFLRVVTSGFTNAASRTDFVQSIESVRTFANQTIVISFWAKANTGTPKIGVEIQQNFGTGGSPSSVVNTAVGAVTIGTTWQRYSISVAVPTIASKTIGTANNDHFNVRFWLNAGSDNATRASSIGIQNNTFEIWGVQVESGSVATAFQTATGTIQGELAACQRYYYRFAATGTNQYFGSAYARSTTNAFALVKQPVTMRTAPSLSFASGASYFNFQIGSGDFTVTTLDGSYYATTDTALVRMTSSGMTTGQGGMALFQNASAYIEMSAEL